MLKGLQLAELVVKRDDRANDPKLWTNVLAEVPLLAGMNARHLRKVAGAARIRRFHDGSRIIQAGEPGEAMHLVLDGHVTVHPARGRALTLGAGSLVGELALLDGGPRTASVVAKGDIVTLSITRAKFRKLLTAEPQLAIAIAEELARRLRASVGDEPGATSP